MAFGTRASAGPVREIDFGDVGASYVAVGSPLTDYTRIISFQNGLDQHVYISLDGTTDNFRMANNSFKLLDLSANKIRDDGLFLAAGTQIYIKEVSASVTSGTFWFETIIAEGGV